MFFFLISNNFEYIIYIFIIWLSAWDVVCARISVASCVDMLWEEVLLLYDQLEKSIEIEKKQLKCLQVLCFVCIQAE